MFTCYKRIGVHRGCCFTIWERISISFVLAASVLVLEADSLSEHTGGLLLEDVNFKLVCVLISMLDSFLIVVYNAY